MRITTVASVTERKDFFPENHESSCYELYSIVTSSFTPPHTPTIPQLHFTSTKNLRNAVADAYGAPAQKSDLHKSSYYTPHSIAT